MWRPSRSTKDLRTPSEAKVVPEEKELPPELGGPARFPSTHAEHAAIKAKVLRACVIALSVWN